MGYLYDTEYAARNLIDLAMGEERQIDKLWSRLEQVDARLKAYRWDFHTSDMHEDFSDHYVMAAFHRMAETNQEANAVRSEIDSLHASIEAKQQAVQSICGALLQVAKQGISLVHGSKLAAPVGRAIGDSHLRDVIWAGRNQAIHYEDGVFNDSVTSIFSHLEESFGTDFSLGAHPNLSRAAQIVKLLGWTEYNQYESDMRSLGL
ncbi:hypothetical protein ACFOZ5_14725 [Marinobacter lacisalsi]|uniref:Uncharacterized protein n=1 Tax=Marinobacter lacisalsi TaxID=475979 RepID=A0ABV8QJQ8_9GAMM